MDELTTEELKQLGKILTAANPDAIAVMAQAARFILMQMVLKTLDKRGEFQGERPPQ